MVPHIMFIFICLTTVSRLSRPVSFAFKLIAGLFGNDPWFSTLKPNVSPAPSAILFIF